MLTHRTITAAVRVALDEDAPPSDDITAEATIAP